MFMEPKHTTLDAMLKETAEAAREALTNDPETALTEEYVRDLETLANHMQGLPPLSDDFQAFMYLTMKPSRGIEDVVDMPPSSTISKIGPAHLGLIFDAILQLAKGSGSFELLDHLTSMILAHPYMMAAQAAKRVRSIAGLMERTIPSATDPHVSVINLTGDESANPLLDLHDLLKELGLDSTDIPEPTMAPGSKANN